MTTAESYLEKLQGLLLFMYNKRGHLPSLYQLQQLDPIVRADLESEFRVHYEDMVADANRRNDKSLLYLKNITKQYRGVHAGSEEEDLYPDSIINDLKDKAVPTVFQHTGTYEIISGLFNDISRVAKRLKFTTPNKIVLGTLFTERVNACAIFLNDSKEHLIIFESQLFYFLNRFIKIITLCLPLKDTNDEVAQFSVKPEDMIAWIQLNPAIQSHFNELIVAFIFEGDIKTVENFILPRPHHHIHHNLLRAIELFIMGHEYTHVVKHHYQEGQQDFLFLNDTHTTESIPGWEKELEADQFGLYLAGHVLAEEGFREDFFLVGADLYFKLSEISEAAFAIKRGDNPSGNSTHPPLKTRRENIRAALKLEFDNEQIASASYLPDMLSIVLDYLWQQCHPLLLEKAKRDK